MRQIIRRITGWMLVLSMITSMFGQSVPMAYAADGNEATGVKPELSFTMTYQSGGSSINQNKDTTDGEQGDLSENLRNKNSALLGRGAENGIIVNLTADLKNGRGTARGMYFELALPVFRVEGSKLIELDQAEIAKLKDEDFEKEIETMAEVYQMEIDKVRDLMGEREKKNMMQDLAVRKAAEFIAENAKESKK